jgi:hypothetical protein
MVIRIVTFGQFPAEGAEAILSRRPRQSGPQAATAVPPILQLDDVSIWGPSGHAKVCPLQPPSIEHYHWKPDALKRIGGRSLRRIRICATSPRLGRGSRDLDRGRHRIGLAIGDAAHSAAYRLARAVFDRLAGPRRSTISRVSVIPKRQRGLQRRRSGDMMVPKGRRKRLFGRRNRLQAMCNSGLRMACSGE